MEIVQSWLVGLMRVTIGEVAIDGLRIEKGKITTSDQRRIRAILIQLGWIPHRSNGVRWYVRPD
jgi:hypothetical protein